MPGKPLLGGRYRLIKPLGTRDRDGLYLAEDIQMQGRPRRLVRRLKLEGDSPRVLKFTAARLKQKVETLRQLSACRHLPTVFDSVETADSIYLVEALVRGPSLAQLLADAPLPEAEVIDIACDLLMGLITIHRWGFIHGNLSAATIIRQATDGALILCEFNGWRVSQSGASLPLQPPDYGKPEREPPPFSQDVYAVGLLALRGLTGLTVREIHEQAALLDAAVPLPQNAASPQLIAVLRHMMSSPARGYPTAAEALEDLRRVKATLAATPTRAPAGSGPQPTLRQLWRWPPLLWPCGTAVAFAVCLLGIWIRLPQQGLSRYFLYQAEMQEGNPQEVAASASQALRHNGRSGAAYLQRGLAYYQLENWTQSRADLTQAIAYQEHAGLAYYYRGLTQEALGDVQGALQDYTQAITLDYNLARTYLRRGTVRAALGDSAGAIADYSLAVQNQPDLAAAYSRRCLARLSLSEAAPALADCSRAIAINPSDPSAYQTRSLVRQRLGELEGAIADATIVIRLEPENAEAYYQRGLLRLESADTAGAMADFSQAVRLQPSHENAQRQRDDLQKTN